MYQFSSCFHLIYLGKKTLLILAYLQQTANFYFLNVTVVDHFTGTYAHKNCICKWKLQKNIDLTSF